MLNCCGGWKEGFEIKINRDLLKNRYLTGGFEALLYVLLLCSISSVGPPLDYVKRINDNLSCSSECVW